MGLSCKDRLLEDGLGLKLDLTENGKFLEERTMEKRILLKARSLEGCLSQEMRSREETSAQLCLRELHIAAKDGILEVDIQKLGPEEIGLFRYV